MALTSLNIKFILRLVTGLALTHSIAAQMPTNVTLRDYLERRWSSQTNVNEKPKKVAEVCSIDTDQIALRVFSEYGSMFVSDGTKLPSTCIYTAANDVEAFHKEIAIGELEINGTKIELQKRALDALFEATKDAALVGKRITPLDGSIAARRNFQDTLRIWNSRFWPAIDHWVSEGKIDRKDAEATIALPLRQQILKVVEWESKGYFFSTAFSKSIFYSVAPPGTSQHLSLLAFDVVEASDPQIRKILNDRGWFQTIKTDQPHFTYLGVSESELPSRGLKQFTRGGHTFWIPNM